jgi:class 3 adenylate cyclase
MRRIIRHLLLLFALAVGQAVLTVVTTAFVFGSGMWRFGTGDPEPPGVRIAGTGARVASVAGPGEVVVSGTVKDLVAGSGIRFEDRGVQILKGIPGEWHLYAVASA